jgi:YHS domain-containing protein
MEMRKHTVMSCIIVIIVLVAGTTMAGELYPVREPTESEIGKSEICPVMNSEFTVTKSTRVIDYKGKSYYFCCDPCAEQFKKNPDKYVATGELLARQPTESEIGKSEICSVMNSKFTVTKSTPVIDYKEKSYYFCCDPCVEQFKKNPDKYAK